MPFIFNPIFLPMIWPMAAFFYLDEKCKVLDLDRQKAGSMSNGSNARRRSEKKVWSYLGQG